MVCSPVRETGYLRIVGGSTSSWSSFEETKEQAFRVGLFRTTDGGATWRMVSSMGQGTFSR